MAGVVLLPLQGRRKQMSFFGKAAAFAAGVGAERLLSNPEARAQVAKAYRKARGAVRDWAHDLHSAIEEEERAEARGRAKANGGPKGKRRPRSA